jgi:hypothetical protein
MNVITTLPRYGFIPLIEAETGIAVMTIPLPYRAYAQIQDGMSLALDIVHNASGRRVESTVVVSDVLIPAFRTRTPVAVIECKDIIKILNDMHDRSIDDITHFVDMLAAAFLRVIEATPEN